MGRAPCCDKANVKKGPWSPEEDAKLKEYIDKNGTGGNWIAFPQKAGLRRCGKSCRLRWLNYLRPNIRHGKFSDDEDRIICTLFASIGSRWSIIAAQLPGRTDNDIKNYWNTKLKKKLFAMVQSQKKSQQIHHGSFASILKSSSPSSPSSTLLYNCSNNSYQTPPTSFSCSNNTYQTPPTSLSCFEPSYSSSFSNSSASCVSAERYQVHDNDVQVFRGEASCSTSDGSRSNGDHQQSGIQSYSNFYTDESHKLMIMAPNGDHGADGWSDHQKSLNGLWGENESTPLDYGIEEIKQIISTSSCNSFVIDENKADGKVMYYY